MACGSDHTSSDAAVTEDATSEDAAQDSQDSGSQETGLDGGSADDGADGGTFNVASLPCLVLWLDAAKGVAQNNNTVVNWTDISNHGNNAAQNVQALQPTVSASAINGLPAIHFDKGTNAGHLLVISDNSALQFGQNDFGVWVVARFDNVAAFNATGTGLFVSKFGMDQVGTVGFMLWGNNYAVPNQVTAGLTGAIGRNNVLGSNAPYNDNVARSYALRRAGNTLELRVNGSQTAMITQNQAVNVSAPGVPVRIGAETSASSARLNGDIAEVVVCGGTIGAGDLAALESYFKTKYNL